MNKYIISEYIKRITKEDILNYSKKQNIYLDTNELNILYTYIKTKYKDFLYNPIQILQELKQKLNKNTYNKIEILYNQYKDKI